MILGVMLCYVISVQIEARIVVVKPAFIMGQERGLNHKRFREQNDAYGPETIQLNGRSARAPSWPEANGKMEKKFLLPRTLQSGDQINITGLISNNSEWASISLVTEQHDIASQLYLHFTSNGGNGAIVLKNGKDSDDIPTDLTPTDLIPEFSSSTLAEVLIRLQIESNNGFYAVDFYINESYLNKITLNHNRNDIRYLVFDGAVEKVNRLDFVFA